MASLAEWTSLSKLREMVKDREAWRAESLGPVAEQQQWHLTLSAASFVAVY